MTIKPPPNDKLIFWAEQLALMFTSFVWTMVVLSPLVIFWAVQDMESNWNVILAMSPEEVEAPSAEVVSFEMSLPTETPTAPPAVDTATPTPPATASPIPSATPTLTPSPTPTAVLPPNFLPDTPNRDEPTPVPIAEDEALATDTLTGTASLSPTVTMPPPVESIGPAGLPERLRIPTVGIDTSIIPVGWQLVQQNGRQYTIWDVADYAVGWHETSARIGEPGNTVMAGHHNINGEVFRDLVNVEVGDEIIIEAGGEERIYRIELKTIVKEKGEPIEVRRENAKWIAPTTDERVTMVTCWPYTNNTHRVIVVAKPLADSDDS